MSRFLFCFHRRSLPRLPLNAPANLSPNLPPLSAFATIDPAPASTHSPLAASTAKSSLSVPELQATLNNPSLPLFERYRAMFALRNDASKEAVLALASGFGDESALFRCVFFAPGSPRMRA